MSSLPELRPPKLSMEEIGLSKTLPVFIRDNQYVIIPSAFADSDGHISLGFKTTIPLSVWKSDYSLRAELVKIVNPTKAYDIYSAVSTEEDSDLPHVLILVEPLSSFKPQEHA